MPNHSNQALMALIFGNLNLPRQFFIPAFRFMTERGSGGAVARGGDGGLAGMPERKKKAGREWEGAIRFWQRRVAAGRP